MLSQEKINANYVTFVSKLQKYGCYSEEMMSEMGEDIKNAPYNTNEAMGGAYQGGLIDVVLNVLCSTAYYINEYGMGKNTTGTYNCPQMYLNMGMMMKILLLQHISKAQMFVPTREKWKVSKGIYYDFNDELKSVMKLGTRSVYLCQKYGIRLEEEEMEAMLIMDKADEKSDTFISPLCQMIKSVNQITSCMLLHEAMEKKNKCKEEIEK